MSRLLPTPVPPAQRVWEPVIDQHETWIAINPVQGCPKGCTYCYLQDRAQTRTRPVELATPAQALALLQASPYYHPGAVLALYTCTDALATPRNRAHLIALLGEFAASDLRNPVCLITKCAVTDDVLDAITTTRAAGIPVLVYLSYSGLGPDIERGIDHEALRANFPRLHHHGIPVIHYWRPLVPANSAPETISTVLDWATRYAACTVSVGLKVKPGAREQMLPLWPALADAGLDVEGADAIWPRSTWEALRALPDRYPGYPIYQTNSCALAYALGTPDHFNVHGTPTCAADHCPDAQRERCRTATPPRLRPAAVSERLAWLGMPSTRPYACDGEHRTVTLDEPLAVRDRNNVAQSLQATVHAGRKATDSYWSGKFGGHQPLILD